ncbi:tyrosine-protein kinase receptor [Holotrichia oblita]|uniref:Tyrosine-protein kinase receptor n=1 Tax=Holotrichia oblita TaxID=644536 RepID=A0ACB9T0N7_HOLOL|nr:tyrosine-protein kinase receptor [Holotrichia oblita]
MKGIFNILCLIFLLPCAFCLIYGDDVEIQCINKCNSQNRSEIGRFDMECGDECNRQCEIGCTYWRNGLEQNCVTLCTNTTGVFLPKEFNCVLGCNVAVNIYISQLQAYLGTPPPPVLMADSLTSTSLQLEWNYEKATIPGLKYLVQWKYEKISPSWQFYKKQTWAPNDTIFTVDDLRPYTRYRFRVAIFLYKQNEPVYSSPSVVIMTLPEVRDTQGPILIIGTDQEIVEQGVNMLDEPVTLYNAGRSVKIKGVAIHVKRKLLFVSDSDRYVYKMPLNREANRNRIAVLTPTQRDIQPLDLSVDWLNEQLYILGETRYDVNSGKKMWSVIRCDLDGRGLTVAVAGLKVKPHHIEVDPYNGYLFWILNDKGRSSLYKLDLSDISNGIKHEIDPKPIFSAENLGAFIVDHTNFLLLVSNQNNKTVNSVSLDGKEVHDVRPRISSSVLDKVISLATANKKFYWTDGNQVFFEEYHEEDDTYFHNSFNALMKESYLTVIINMPSSQPIPIPVNPPTLMQAIFGTQRAKTSWVMPHLLGGQGRGAWQNWSYEISVQNSKTKEIQTYKDINVTSYTIKTLKEDAEYVIKAAAYTQSGKGPWSSEFKGRSLRRSKDGKQPMILWSASEGLLQSDTIGENVQTLIHKSSIKDSYFTDTAWYKDQIYLVTNTHQVYMYSFVNHKYEQMKNFDSVRSISVDWIDNAGNFIGTEKETLPIVTMANELIVDSVRAYLYWSTLHTVSCSRLNGDNITIYHTDQLFSGKQVMGLTLDIDHQYVYWIVRGSGGSNLFRAPMAGSDITKGKLEEKVTSLQKADMQGPLCYFNNRLLWLQDDENAVISNLEGRNVAVINGKSLSGLNMVHVMDSTLNSLPGSFNIKEEDINVLPDVVDVSSVRVVGTWDSFNISWRPIENVNFGTVFYEIKIGESDPQYIIKEPTIRYWRQLPPFSEMQISVRASTYWASSSPVRVTLHSPSYRPSEPENLRVFVSYLRQASDIVSVETTVRWEPPKHTNGVIEKYVVSIWESEDEERNEASIEAQVREYKTNDSALDHIYKYQVQAYTNSEGPPAVAYVNTSLESPIPSLIMATQDSIHLKDFDLVKDDLLLNGISVPVELTYSMAERKLFWINDMQELFVYNLETASKSKIFDVNGRVNSLTIDWIERSLYYVQINSDLEGSSVYKIDLNLIEKGLKIMQIFRTPSTITKIEVSPFTQKLYWIEIDRNYHFRLMQSNTNGSEITPFFIDYMRNKRSLDEEDQFCNCALYPTIEKTFTIDHSDPGNKFRLIYVDTILSSILSVDENSCRCEILLNITGDHQKAQTLNKLKSDFNRIYWTKTDDDYLYIYNKRTNDLVKFPQKNSGDFLIYGQHTQPYPPQRCLLPKFSDNLTVSLVAKMSNSLVLQMPSIDIDEDCQNISTGTVEYKVYYMPYNTEDDLQCDETCAQISTFNDELMINGLRPFSRYVFSLSVSNFYSNVGAVGNRPRIGPGTVIKTAVGAPTRPRNISVTVLNPTLLKVSWLPPEEFNGDTIYYEIHWQTESTTSGIRQKSDQTVMENNMSFEAKPFSAYLTRVSPNETYLVWVRAYSRTNVTFTDSASEKITTFPEPDNITIANYSAYLLRLEWKTSNYISNYTLQYTLLTSNDWKNVLDYQIIIDGGLITAEIGNLKPKTQYKFRFLLTYPKYDRLYIWPKDSRFTFETSGDRPTPPGKPEIRFINRNESKIWWQPSKDNGAPIELYKLEGMTLKNYRQRRSTNRSAWYHNAPSIEEQNWKWEEFYNGTETFWNINGLDPDYRYSFRALAFNEYGWSEPSEDTEFDPTTAALLAEKSDPLTMITVAIGVPVLILLLLLMCLGCFVVAGKCECGKHKKDLHIITPIRRPDVELATLRELPRRTNFIHNTNILYVSAQPTVEEITHLPHIRRDQITLMNFLGSGAFGEVFEGKARDLRPNGLETKVAVKTLRKGASEQEKTEFLQEAQLMSHFKHQHILQLLGVCLDNDPQFIIMELMEGGDLLTYLRSSRKPTSNTPPLTLLELLKMCVDVATGCRYLEEMHFVHRDLACRNCLVSSTDPETRIVKIGDFGLARDIYKNDYYRKEGEGLLPVRWMAPESLVDGVFTSQSDVWAFGVLLWEIMTLGQQPYPARNNLEVLHYVRRGGRLGKPVDCPEELHELMLLCWSFEPERRPTFKYCLETLNILHDKISKNPVTGAHNGQYISTVPERNMKSLFKQIPPDLLIYKHTGGSWKNTSNDSSRERTPFLNSSSDTTPNSTEIPKYLEIVYGSETSPENDGYEIPRNSIRSTKSMQEIPQDSSSSSATDVDNNSHKMSVNNL